MCELAEADTADIKISHISSLTAAQLTASYDAASILRFALSAHPD
jgi:hypothetical protein